MKEILPSRRTTEGLYIRFLFVLTKGEYFTKKTFFVRNRRSDYSSSYFYNSFVICFPSFTRYPPSPYSPSKTITSVSSNPYVVHTFYWRARTLNVIIKYLNNSLTRHTEPTHCLFTIQFYIVLTHVLLI